MPRLTERRAAALRKQAKSAPHPIDRLAAWRELRDYWDEVLDRNVRQAHERGCSYAEIGEALGMSKQAVQQRWFSTKRRK